MSWGVTASSGSADAGSTAGWEAGSVSGRSRLGSCSPSNGKGSQFSSATVPYRVWIQVYPSLRLFSLSCTSPSNGSTICGISSSAGVPFVSDGTSFAFTSAAVSSMDFVAWLPSAFSMVTVSVAPSSVSM